MSFQDSNQQPLPPPQGNWGTPEAQQQQQQQGQQQQSWGTPGVQQQQGAQQQQSWGQPGAQRQQPGQQQSWGTQAPVQPQQPQQQSWGTPGGQAQASWGQQPGQYPQMPPQQPGAQGSWGASSQNPAPGGGQAWGSQQAQMPGQQGYGSAPGAAPGQSFGQPQDYVPQNFAQQPQMPPMQQMPQQQAYASGGFASAPAGYPQQSDFGSGVGFGPGPGYPAPGPQRNSGLATTALWLGIFGGFGLINLVVSILAINDTGPGKKAGRGKALTGLCLTLAWSVLWIGLVLAVMNHAKTVGLSAAPKDTFTVSAPAGSGGGSGGGANSTATSPTSVPTGAAGVVFLQGATDPGCVTVQNAYNNLEASKGSPSALSAFVSALKTGATQSQSAGSQIGTVASDWSGGNVSQAQMTQDTHAMETACGMTTTSTDPQ